MDNDEKKFTLDELPDKGSEPEIKAPPPPKKEKPEPRLEKIKKLKPSEQVEALGQRWYFDKPKRNWGWLIALIALIYVEKAQLFHPNNEHRKRFAEESHGVSEIAFVGVDIFDFLFVHPLIFAILIPLIFKFWESSAVFFEITFSGINAVRRIPVGTDLAPTRVSVKWDEIKNVSKDKAGKRDILIIHDKDGPVAELIWDIDEVKKKVIKQVVKGLVSNKHPFREFIEKEVA